MAGAQRQGIYGVASAANPPGKIADRGNVIFTRRGDTLALKLENGWQLAR